MMLNSIQQLHEILDQQRGIQDGVSLAYNIGTTDLTIQQALEAAAGQNEFYLRGLVEGFQTITGKKNVPDVD